MPRKRKGLILNYRDRIALLCKKCGSLVENLPSDTGAVTCWRCMALMTERPSQPKSTQPTEKRGRGWQFKKKYISPSGKEYRFGKEVKKRVRNTATDKVNKSKTKKLVGKKTTRANKKRSGNQLKNRQARRTAKAKK